MWRWYCFIFAVHVDNDDVQCVCESHCRRAALLASGRVRSIQIKLYLVTLRPNRSRVYLCLATSDWGVHRAGSTRRVYVCVRVSIYVFICVSALSRWVCVFAFVCFCWWTRASRCASHGAAEAAAVCLRRVASICLVVCRALFSATRDAVVFVALGWQTHGIAPIVLRESLAVLLNLWMIGIRSFRLILNGFRDCSFLPISRLLGSTSFLII